MALTVEDGTGVTDSNTYIDTDDLITYAANLGTTIIEADASIAIYKSMRWIETQEYQGVQVDDDQSLSWPRKYVYINDVLQDSAVIPKQLINAQLELAYQIYLENDPLDPGQGDIKSMKVGPLDITYQDYGSNKGSLESVTRWIAPLLDGGGNGLHFKVERSYY